MKNMKKAEETALEKEQPTRDKPFKWSKTSLVDFENAATCPKRWKAQWLDRLFKPEPTDTMLGGLYFESLVLGQTAGDDTLDGSHFKRNRDGSKKVDQVRIEKQAGKVKAMLFDKDHDSYLGFDVKQVQVVLEGGTATHPLKGVLDIIAEKEGKPAIVDLKLTKSISGGRPPYSYDEVSSMDMAQAVIYTELYKQAYGQETDFYFLVADYSPQMRIKLIKVNLSNKTLDSVMGRLDNAAWVLEMYEANGWVTDPSINECRGCPLECADRKRPNEVEYEEVFV